MRGGSGDRRGSGGGINAALQARPLKLAPMGAGRSSTTFLVASSIVVDSVPASAMMAVGSVALLPDFTAKVRGVHCFLCQGRAGRGHPRLCGMINRKDAGALGFAGHDTG